MSETEMLIELVKERPLIYNHNDPDYKNRVRRQETWLEIAVEMGAGDGNIWSAKWKGLKDNYAKYKKTSDPIAGAAYKKYKNWPWAELMKFLDDFSSFANRKNNYCIHNTCSTNNSNSNTVTNSDPVQDTKFCNVQLFIPDTQITSPVEELQDPVPEGSESYVSEVKKRKKSRSEPSDELHNEYLKMKRSENATQLDGVDHFFLSYAQSFKKLPSRMQIMLKLEIATLFSRYELQAEGVTSDCIDNISRIVPHPVKSEYDFSNSVEDE